MIVGLGLDLVDIERMRALHARFGARVAARLLSAAEHERYRRAEDPARVLAKRFAAKEAAAKALGTGIGQGVRFQDLSTEHDAAGAPRLQLHGRAREIADGLGVTGMHLSLSDERRMVAAVVMLEALPRGLDGAGAAP